MANSVLTKPVSWVGRSVLRKEDPRFLRGEGNYVDDRRFANAVYVTPVRSPLAHGRIRGIVADEALTMDGVLRVVTGEDLRPDIHPLKNSLPEPFNTTAAFPLAVERVRYQGEPVAVVVSEDPYVGEDAAEAVQVDYEPLPVVVDPFIAKEDGSERIHPGLPSNVVWRRDFNYGPVAERFAEADVVVRRKLHIHRFTSAPLETAAAVAEYDPHSGVYTVWSNLQVPERYRGAIAGALGIPPRLLHFQCPDIGGGFGIKLHLQWVIVVCWLARQLERPVKWLEDRTGHLSARHHGHEVWYDAALAVKRDGTILGLRAEALLDAGAYLEREPKGAVNQLRHATGLYGFDALAMQFTSVVTNKCPTGPNRAYGKVQQIFLVERLIDEAARELGMDPAEMRRRNLVPPEAMPYRTPTGALHDGGDYPKALEQLLRHFDYAAFRQRQREARAQGQWLGVGIAAGVEASPSNAEVQRLVNPAYPGTGDSEAALVRIEDNGKLYASVGSVPQGHGHETVVSQLVADAFGVKPDDVTVAQGYDSWRDPSTPYSGTHASRFAVMGGGAVDGACQRLRTKVLTLAADRLGIAAEQLVIRDGAVQDPETGRSLTFVELARLANYDLEHLPPGMEPGLESRYVFHPDFGPRGPGDLGNFSLTYAYSIALVEVAVDPAIGRIRLNRIVYTHDCGRQLNPMIVEGQSHGAIAHQIGGAFFEQIRYDESGQLLTATFKDYLTPTAKDLPRYEMLHLETPSMFSPIGARGGGEGPGTPLVAAINAVADALAPEDVSLQESHITPSDIWELLNPE